MTFFNCNGVDISHFKKVQLNIEMPSDFKQIELPILSFTDAIGDIYFTLLEDILKNYPNVSVALIGRALQ